MTLERIHRPNEDSMAPPRISPELRFWSKVTILENGCWLWTGSFCSILRGRYGLFRPGGTANSIGAHVWAYQYCIGEIPEGLELDHTCRNPACVNPWHLEPVTRRINQLRAFGFPRANAAKTHCSQGHPYSGENLLIAYNGRRRCRICSNLDQKRRKRLQAALRKHTNKTQKGG